MTIFDELRDWYCAQCDGDWEHSYGVVIESLDNPGWQVTIDLRDTILEDNAFPVIESGDSDEGTSWIVCKVEDNRFQGGGDPSRLEEIIGHFLCWAKDRPEWLALPAIISLQERDNLKLWDQLGRNRGAEICRAEGCVHRRIRHSVFCRFHHWEKVFGRLCPFEESAT